MDVIGAILAGGQSARMGEDKAGVDFAGKPMIDHVSEALSEVVEMHVVLGTPRPGVETWPDEVDSAGPLSGLATVLERADARRVLIVAVDHALVRSQTLAGLLAISSNQAVIPVDHHGVRQVTCAVYPTSLASLAIEELTGGGSIQSLVDRAGFEPVTPDIWEGWGEDGRSWFSIDTPDALADALRLYG